MKPRIHRNCRFYESCKNVHFTRGCEDYVDSSKQNTFYAEYGDYYDCDNYDPINENWGGCDFGDF